MRGFLKEKVDSLDFMKKYPEKIMYSGNLELLKRKKISIVGTRKPIQYTKTLTHNLSSAVISNKKPEYTIINRNN